MARVSLVIALLAAGLLPATAQDNTKPDPVRVEAAVMAAFPNAAADWQARLVSDETLKLCSTYRGSPPQAIFEKIEKSEKAKIQYPTDGKFLGDWNAGEKIAQSGYGLRFTDYPPTQPNGGNCYACHQLTKQEVSYGTLGPSLLQYGKLRNFGEADTKAAYEKIYNAQAALPCSNMPRFGVNKVLTMEQIKHLVALLMSPDSPVNK
jgi:L-cysteine S-thiosulfotransferase